MQLQLGGQEQALDDFITALEFTLSQLQVSCHLFIIALTVVITFFLFNQL